MTDKKLVVLALAALLACCLGAAGCRGGGQTPTAGAPGTSAAPSESAPKPETPVVIEAYYPLNESHEFIADYLKSVEAANPGTVSVTVYDMQSQEGRRKWSMSGLSCAGVFVNGSTRHEIEREGKTETVDFLQRMDVFWTREDFETVLAQELAKVGESFRAPPQETEAEAGEAEGAEEKAPSKD